MSSLNDLPPGRNVPTDVNALIEISKGAGSVKYEFDRHSGVIVVDRLRTSSMFYPINYGCIPQTLSDDGDPLDILVYCTEPIQTGTVIPARPIGVLLMEDEKGPDVKILAVPADRVTDAYLHIQSLSDLSDVELRNIEHFFKHYKDLESGRGKHSVTAGWEDLASAHRYIQRDIQRAIDDTKSSGGSVPPAPPGP